MRDYYFNLIAGLIVTIISIDLFYRGLQMVRLKQKILLWPQKFMILIISILFGQEYAKNREEIFLKRAKYYEGSAVIGGFLGLIIGILFIINTFLKLP